MATYRIQLIPASPNFHDALDSFSSDFQAAADYFNSCGESMRNKKELKFLGVQGEVLSLELTSEIDLPTPGKSLRLFSRYLLENSKISDYAYCGSLFRSTSVTKVPDIPSAKRSVEEEVMCTLTRLLVGDIPNRKTYFSIFNTLLKSVELNETAQNEFLSHIRAHLANKLDEVKKESV